ncbi:MAG: DUF4390 domain-containing protein [Gammaproteobacteria bacterium]|nr:DUF4390 domain-containing protein [Gammaproteobacteria bacterium]
MAWKSKIGHKIFRHWLICLAVAFCAAWQAHAAEEEDRFTVQTAYTELIDGVYYLNADIEYGLSEEALTALRNSVPLTIVLEIEIIRDRRFFFNNSIAELEQSYQISFHPLSGRYVVKNLNSGEIESYVNYRTAIARLGQVTELPIFEETLMEEDANYLVRMRAILDLKQYKAPLRLFASLFSDWKLSSDYYEWTLRSSNE